jgi:hypothetical protein
MLHFIVVTYSCQDRTKPGRQIVTFLLICNLAIWVIYTFEVQKVEESPVQVGAVRNIANFTN